jgi:hypothetical protein
MARQLRRGVAAFLVVLAVGGAASCAGKRHEPPPPVTHTVIYAVTVVDPDDTSPYQITYFDGNDDVRDSPVTGSWYRSFLIDAPPAYGAGVKVEFLGNSFPRFVCEIEVDNVVQVREVRGAGVMCSVLFTDLKTVGESGIAHDLAGPPTRVAVSKAPAAAPRSSSDSGPVTALYFAIGLAVILGPPTLIIVLVVWLVRRRRRPRGADVTSSAAGPTHIAAPPGAPSGSGGRRGPA